VWRSSTQVGGGGLQIEVLRPQIEVRAGGLNFRDVMAASGLLPAEAEDEPAWQRVESSRWLNVYSSWQV